MLLHATSCTLAWQQQAEFAWPKVQPSIPHHLSIAKWLTREGAGGEEAPALEPAGESGAVVWMKRQRVPYGQVPDWANVLRGWQKREDGCGSQGQRIGGNPPSAARQKQAGSHTQREAGCHGMLFCIIRCCFRSPAPLSLVLGVTNDGAQLLAAVCKLREG